MARRSTRSPAVLRFKRTPLLVGLGVLFGLGILLAAGGFAFAAAQESHDIFCASCHTQPESAFYERSLDAQAVDLASAHTAHEVRCIDCHSGQGVTGRLQAELLGAHNALAYFTGTAVQPAQLTKPIDDESCLKCHPEVSVTRSMENHFHLFLARWQAADSQAATCASCHGGHATDGSASLMFLNETRTRATCDACHRAIGEGE